MIPRVAVVQHKDTDTRRIVRVGDERGERQHEIGAYGDHTHANDYRRSPGEGTLIGFDGELGFESGQVTVRQPAGAHMANGHTQ